MNRSQPTIFVSIASYCDPVLPFTLDGCLANARYPENLRFGLCWQFDDTAPIDLSRFKADRRFRVSEHNCRDSEGGSWARSIAQQLWDGETYTMQIDSHMALAPHWDTNLVRMMRELPAERPLITMIAPLFWFDDKDRLRKQTDPDIRTTKIEFWEERTGWAPWFVPAEPNTRQPGRNRFLSGQFVFTLGVWNDEVRQDPQHYYWGEEFALTVRSFTHGYDLFLPDDMVVWHMIHRHGPPRRHWEHGREVVAGKNKIAFERLRQLAYSDEHTHLGRYGLGTRRSLQDFERFVGMDLKNKRAHPDVFLGRNPDPVTIKTYADWAECVTIEEFNKARKYHLDDRPRGGEEKSEANVSRALQTFPAAPPLILPSPPDASFTSAYQARRRAITAVLMTAQAGVVGGGPFAGMKLLADTSWADGDLAPKLLGCYEAELHSAIERAAARNPRLVVNIGCAEGYYAVGIARLLPAARVHAFEINERGQAVCRNAAIANGVGERLSVAGKCDSGSLRKIAAQSGRILLIVDCEGAELDLLDPERIPALERCDMIVECHDFANPMITHTLRERFAASHDIETVFEGPRDPNKFTQLRQLHSIDRWIAVNEDRPLTMNWVVCWARSSGDALGKTRVNFGDGRMRDVFFRPGTSDEDIIRVARANHFDLARLRRLQELRDFAARMAAGGKRPLIVDAGSNIGTTSAWFACNFAGAQVMAIEPDPGNFSMLVKNVEGLAIEPMNAAVSARRGFARIIDPGDGYVGLRTESVSKSAQGTVPRLTINDLYSRATDRFFPFIVKVDIEGGEADLFSANTGWVARTPLLIVELHDWLLNRSANSKAFLRCISRLDRDFVYFGEHIYSIANDLDG